MDKKREFRSLTRWSLALSLAVVAPHGHAATPSLPEAEITSLFGTVTARAPDGSSRAARNGAKIPGTDALRTGEEARVELIFSDRTVVRLGGHTSFTIGKGTRNLKLDEGVLLVQAPKSAKGVTIRAGACAAEVTGSTVVLEFRPGVCKFVVLEGIGRLHRPGHFGDSVLVRPGQLVIGDPSQPVSDPVDFEVARFLKTCRFITEFSPLPSERAMVLASEKQQLQKSRKKLIGTNLVIFGGGGAVSLLPPVLSDALPHMTSAALVAPLPAELLSTDLGTVEELPSSGRAADPAAPADPAGSKSVSP